MNFSNSKYIFTSQHFDKKVHEIPIIEGFIETQKQKWSLKVRGPECALFTGQHQTYLKTIVKHFSLQISKRGNSFHQQFAKQRLLAAVTSDLFVV